MGITRRIKGALWRASDRLGARPVRINSGPAQGKRLVAPIRRWRVYRQGLHEAPLLAVINQQVRPGQTVLDLGASYGYFTLALAARVGPGGRVVAFEPEPGAAAALRRTLTLNRLPHVQMIEAAVDEISKASFLQVPHNETMSHLTDRPGGTTVDAVSLDDWLSEPSADGPIEAVDWIKIDVEGAEARVLAGAEATLARFRPRILCEVHGSPAFPGGARETVERLRRADYRLAPVPTEGRSLDERLQKVESTPTGTHLRTFHLLAEPN